MPVYMACVCYSFIDYLNWTWNPGDLVLIHGSVLHKSERNKSPHTRFAYTFHMIDSPPFSLYDHKNWLQPTVEMPFSRVLDAVSRDMPS